MNFELLSNEIILDLFDYLNGMDLLRAFYGINVRLNLLLYQQFRGYHFNFFSVSKCQFDLVCQHHIPFIVDRIVTLTVSDYELTPEQINLFLSYVPSISQFTNLRSLTLWNIRSSRTLLKITEEFHHLHNLIRLNLSFHLYYDDQVDFQLINNNILSISKLTHCHYESYFGKQQYFHIPTKLSRFLRNLYISNFKIRWNQIYQLFLYASRMKHLSIYIDSDENDQHKLFSCPTLNDLSIIIFNIDDNSKMISFLQNLSNLHCLKINLAGNLIDGCQWEQVIRYYLPKLKVFYLNMKQKFSVNQNIQERVDELIHSFESSFWINEHKWFVRCFTYGRSIVLETLSEIYYHFQTKLPDSCKSTNPQDDHQKFYNTIRNIYCDRFFDQPFSFNFCLSEILHLSIKFPIHNRFWSIVPSLKKLSSLTVSSISDVFQSQFQTLLDRAPHLHRLSISQDKSLPLQMSLFKYTTGSIRRLDLNQYNYQFNEEECLTLSHSPLSVRCEILFIQVTNRECIINLIKNMINLRALYIKYEDGEYFKHLSSINNVDESHNANTLNNDHLVQWLKNHLPSTCSIVRNSNPIDQIQIWIQ
ncbi:unnamed protein product [Rotaria sp. Silwood1]|nr:unnamed protein product [Rotaria sp. Silwood1]